MKLNKCSYCKGEVEKDYAMGVYAVFCPSNIESCEMNYLEYNVPIEELYNEEVIDSMSMCWNTLNPAIGDSPKQP